VLKRGSVAVQGPGGSDRLNVGLIGVGGRGAINLAAFARAGEHVAALCDVDETALLEGRNSVAERCADVRLYKDFRVMLESEKGLDAVVISTPDHMHGLQAAWAMDKGCPVYIETPLVRTLGELCELRTRAKAKRVLVQAGNQGSALDEFRHASEMIASGIIGEVSEVHAWTTRPVWPQGVVRPDGSDPVPAALDWDLWLGVAPLRPYKSKVYHRFNWRGWFDFGTGALGDGGGHLLNLPFRALGLGAPVAVETESGSEFFAETFCKNSKVRFEFAARGKHPAVKLFWYDGGRKPSSDIMPQVLTAFGQIPDTGCLLLGEKGLWLTTDDLGKRHYLALREDDRVADAEKHEAWVSVPAAMTRVKSQQQEFLDAVRSGERTYSDLGCVGPLMESLLVGCVAQRVPGRLEWNGRKGRFIKHGRANFLIASEFRDGWGYPQ
jgi:predicted dehydrogenase